MVEQLSWSNLLNAYLIDTPAGPVLVDCWAHGLYRCLRSELKKHGLDADDLAAVVLTHFHMDHAGLAFRFAERGVPVCAAGPELPILAGNQPHPGYGLGPAGKAVRIAEKTFFPPVRLERVTALEEGEQLFSSGWRVIFTPGHSPGSLALFHDGTGDLISGDTLVCDLGWPRSAHPLFTPDYGTAMRSGHALLDLEPKTIHPGHGPALPKSAYHKVHERLKRVAGATHR